MDRDRDLFAYLDTRFDGIDHRFEKMQAQLDRVEETMDRRFEEMQGQMDGRFKEMQGHLNRVEETMDRRFEETHNQIRHTNVVVEELRSKIEMVAEGHVMLDAKLDRFHGELKTERRQDRDEHRAALKRLRRRDDKLEVRVERLEAARR